MILRSLTAAAAVVSVLTANTINVNGVEYTQISSTEVSVSGSDEALSGAVVIPEKVQEAGKSFSVTAIDDRAFENRGAITSVSVPKTVSAIGNDAFSFCSSLTEVVLADGPANLALGYIPNLNAGLFADTRLEKLYLGRNMSYTTRRGYSPFSGSRTLASVVIGEMVNELGAYAFSDCASLTSITLLCRIPPAAVASAFDGVSKTRCVLTVPEGTVEAYRSAPVWSDFATITDGTSSIGEIEVEPEISVNVSGGMVSLSGLTEGYAVSVTRLDGTALSVNGVEDGMVNITGLPSGCYILTVYGLESASSFKVMAP